MFASPFPYLFFANVEECFIKIKIVIRPTSYSGVEPTRVEVAHQEGRREVRVCFLNLEISSHQLCIIGFGVFNYCHCSVALLIFALDDRAEKKTSKPVTD